MAAPHTQSGQRPWPAEAPPPPAPAFQQLAWAAAPRPSGSGSAAAGPSQPRPRVLVVGGSMGGCCAALALGQLGCDVRLFEKAAGDLQSQGAGLVVQPDMADFLERHHVVHSVEELCIKSAGRQYVDCAGGVTGGDANPQLFSAWDVLHRALKAKVPPGVYHSGSAVVGVSSSAASGGGGSSGGAPLAQHSSSGQVCVEVESGGERQRQCGDLLVACDGPGSLVRRTFLPDVHSQYQGYLAWRGFAAEQDLPEHVLRFIANKFTVHQMPCSHILAYTIPGADGSTEPGRRRVNWVWYVNTPAQELPRLFLDTNGHQHLYSVPRGLLRPEVAAERKRMARLELPPVLADLVEHTSDVFAQAIHDLLAPRLAVAPACCLLGDAGCILRPHTAAGTTKAAVNATALAACLERHGFNVAAALEDYSSSQLELARYLVDVGRSIGTRSQFPEDQ